MLSTTSARTGSCSPLRGSYGSPLAGAVTNTANAPNSNFFGGTFHKQPADSSPRASMMHTKDNAAKLRVIQSNKRISAAIENPYQASPLRNTESSQLLGLTKSARNDLSPTDYASANTYGTSIEKYIALD